MIFIELPAAPHVLRQTQGMLADSAHVVDIVVDTYPKSRGLVQIQLCQLFQSTLSYNPKVTKVYIRLAVTDTKSLTWFVKHLQYASCNVHITCCFKVDPSFHIFCIRLLPSTKSFSLIDQGDILGNPTYSGGVVSVSGTAPDLDHLHIKMDSIVEIDVPLSRTAKVDIISCSNTQTLLDLSMQGPCGAFKCPPPPTLEPPFECPGFELLQPPFECPGFELLQPPFECL